MASSIKKIYTDSFKKAVVNEAIKINNIAKTGRNHGISPNTIRRWIDTYK
jgi:transposase-like protein